MDGELETAKSRRGHERTMILDGPIIVLNHLSKVYGDGPTAVRALRDVSLTVQPGEFVTIMGPSGSGKSTLMHILGCLDTPTTGTYHLAGDDVSQLDETALAGVRNRRIGFVFQQFHLLASLPAWRNVELPLIYAGEEANPRQVRALAVLASVGLADRVTHRPNQLSGGQQQRVAIARALVTDPAIILADEPTGNLDSASSAEVLQLLSDLHRLGRTIILITHDAEVAKVAQRVVRIRDGQIEEDVS